MSELSKYYRPDEGNKFTFGKEDLFVPGIQGLAREGKTDDFIVLRPHIAREVDHVVREGPRSISEMLDANPSLLPSIIFSWEGKPLTIDPTSRALSRIGTLEERREIYGGVKEFLADPETEAFVADTFHVPGKSFRNRPPLQITTDALFGVEDEADKYLGYIFKDPSSSLYFVLENEHGPIASTGFNQFSDGVEIRYVQGVSSAKIGRKSAEDLSRLPGWSERLVGLVERYAEHQGLEHAMILPAEENIWVNEGKFPIERARKMYDDMAERRGYVYNAKLKRFIKPLQAA
jgi:hypothetical protein